MTLSGLLTKTVSTISTITTETVKYWRCVQKGCTARLAKRISSSSLVGENLPEHDPPTNLMKRKANEVEISAIKNVAAVPGSSAKAMLCDISHSLSHRPSPTH
jgi:hypothetical protein